MWGNENWDSFYDKLNQYQSEEPFKASEVTNEEIDGEVGEILDIEIIHTRLTQAEGTLSANVTAFVLGINTEHDYLGALLEWNLEGSDPLKGWKLTLPSTDDWMMERTLSEAVTSFMQEKFPGFEIVKVTTPAEEMKEYEECRKRDNTITIKGDTLIFKDVGMFSDEPYQNQVATSEIHEVFKACIDNNLGGNIERKEFWNTISKKTRSETENLIAELSSYEGLEKLPYGGLKRTGEWALRFNISFKASSDETSSKIFLQFEFLENGELIKEPINLPYESYKAMMEIAPEEMERFSKLLKESLIDFREENTKDKAV